MIPKIEWVRKNSWRVVSSRAERIQTDSPAAASAPTANSRMVEAFSSVLVRRSPARPAEDRDRRPRGPVARSRAPPLPRPGRRTRRPRRPSPPPIRLRLPGRRGVHPPVAAVVVLEGGGAGGFPAAGVVGGPAAGVGVARPLVGVVAVQVGAAELLEQRLPAVRRRRRGASRPSPSQGSRVPLAGAVLGLGHGSSRPAYQALSRSSTSSWSCVTRAPLHSSRHGQASSAEAFGKAQGEPGRHCSHLIYFHSAANRPRGRRGDHNSPGITWPFLASRASVVPLGIHESAASAGGAPRAVPVVGATGKGSSDRSANSEFRAMLLDVAEPGGGSWCSAMGVARRTVRHHPVGVKSYTRRYHPVIYVDVRLQIVGIRRTSWEFPHKL